MNKMKRIVLSIAMATLLAIAPQAFAMEGGEGSASKLHLHGYGELHYNSPSGDPAKMDLHRMVWGVSYDFSDRIQLHTEVDFEHAARDMELEFAYIDFLFKPAFNVRAGALLMPVGPLNEFHEPTLFYSVERPLVENDMIPTTWQEGGLGIFGSPMEGLKYRVYLVSGLSAEKFSEKGIRGSRGKVAGGTEDKHICKVTGGTDKHDCKVTGGTDRPLTGDDLAFVGRAEYAALPGLDLGLSIYQGGANQKDDPALDGAGVGITEADIRLRKKGADIRFVYVTTKIDEAAKISKATGKTIGEKQAGMYLELAYNIGNYVPFARMEQINTHDAVAAGAKADDSLDRDILTLGLAYYPHHNHRDVALKADWSEEENAAGGTSTWTNFGIAWMF